VLASSNYAPEVRVRLRLKSFDRDSVHDAGSWPAMADGCGCRGMAAIADRSAGSVRDGLSFGCGGTCAGIAATR
jgi:hypothetical protein